MALRALRAGQVESGQRPTRGGVVELAVSPEHRVMALLTGSRESKLDVVHRRGRIVVIGLMTADARCVRDVVIVVDVAHRARHCRVRVITGQRESRLRMVKLCRLPGCRVMAGLACGRETSRNVIRVIGVIEVCLVTPDAAGIGAGQIVIVVRMALAALRSC